MSQPMPSSYPSDQLKPQVSPLSSSSFLTRLAGSVVLLNLFVITLVVLSIHQSHRQYEERAEITTQNLTQTLESEIAGALKTDDVALFAVMEEYKKQRAVGLNEKVLNAYIERVRSRLPEIDALRITDAKGMLVYGSDVIPSAKISLADRSHFILNRDNPHAGLVISKPLVSRANKKWVIVLARRIDQPDGSFGGIVFAAITLEQLSRTFSALNIGSHGIVALLDSELGIVVRHPEPQRIGSVTGQKVESPSLRALIQTNSASGTYQTHSAVDGIVRTFSYRRVDGHPLFIIVGLANEDYLAEWHNEAAKQAALAALFALITFLAAWQIYRSWKRKINLVDTLFRQEAKFHTVADFTFHWEYWKGSNEEILYMTPSCERVTGYTRAEFVADPSLLLSIIHPEDRHVMDEHLHTISSQSYQDGSPVDFRIVRHDGDIRWISHHCRVITGPNGEDMGRRVSNRDVTELKQAERELTNNINRYQGILRNMTDAYWRVDKNGRIVEANFAISKMHGYSIEELLQMSISDFEVIESEEETRSRIETIRREGHLLFESKHRCKDGKIIDVEISANLSLDDPGNVDAFHRDITERRQVENALRESEAHLRIMLENELVGIVTVKDRIIQWANPAHEKLLGYEKGELNGVPARVIFLNDDDYQAFGEKAYPLINAGKVFRSEHKFLRKDGSLITVDVSSVILNPETGETLWNCVDLTESKRAEESLRITASVFDNTQEAIVISDANNIIIDVNAAFTRITGYSREEALGKNPKFLSSGRQGKDFFTQMWQSLEHERSWRGEIWNRRKSGEIYAELLSISAICDDEGKVKRYVAVFSDISHIKEHEDELRRVAHYDTLTGIPNRALLADRMKQSIAQTAREKNMMAVCYLDLDGFKPINDTYGHEAGDQVLIEVANRIEKTIRGGDTVARLGGDEFVVLLLGLEKGEECVSTLERLLTAIAQPIIIKNKSNKVTASIGVSIYPLDEEDPDTLFRHADQAMYVAKQSGKNRFHIYDPAIDKYARDQHEFLERIRHALIKKEFVLYYQPKVNMCSGKIIGAEALIRWQHPEKGLLPPSEFLPMTEDNSLAIEIGEWVIDTALTQMELWQAAGLDIPVSVNVGAHQLQQPDFVHRLTELLATHPEIRHGCLELEVLETSALDDLARASEIINACREIGVMFALDDFGTGYSSLTYLKALPASMLKIDQSFVRDMLDDPDDLAILEGVLGLATAFRRKVIAEGVETIEHGTLLLQLGCELAQGYGIARPMPAQEIPVWTTTWRPDSAWVNLPSVSRDDLPVLFASVEHRAWIVAIRSFLNGEREAPPPLNHHECRFGTWLEGEGLARHAAKPAFHTIELLHRQVHALAMELQKFHLHGRNQEALTRLGELYQLRDALLEQLKMLVHRNGQ
jgi:diguanylate cyclase (GGDEF)-like protein/PAS domain S-box-containing protein